LEINYLIKNKKLELKYQPGKGAWTYHIQIPNTKSIIGKWGSMKVSGFIDAYKLESKNLFSIKGQDKLISINESIRKAIHKTGGDIVTVTLCLDNPSTQITKADILDIFKNEDVFTFFKKLPTQEQSDLIEKFIAVNSEEQRNKMIVKYIDQLIKANK
jgi:hypothetical protein